MSQPHAPDASAADARPFLTADWRHLVMANYAIDPDVLRPRVPVGTELDAWGDTTWVSLVAFQFRDTRLLGVRVPFHGRFEEIKLRFYVRRDLPDGPRRGKRERRALAHPRVGSQLAFARVATALAACSVGALAVGALAIGAAAVGRLAIKRLTLQSGSIRRLTIDELEVGRLSVREIVTEGKAAEARPGSE